MRNLNIDSFVKNRVREQKWREVVSGKTALIFSSTPIGEEELFIDANKIFLKCSHCGKIHNKKIEEKNGRKLSRRS